MIASSKEAGLTDPGNMPPQISSPSEAVWQQVLDEIRRQIIVGELEPGARLVETMLAHTFGVSRGPVRTALMALEQTGLVRSSDRRGVEVADFSSDDIAELFAVRIALEVVAVRTLAERHSPATLDRLHAHLVSKRKSRSRAAAVEAVEADLAFHEEICASCGNHVLLVTWSSIADCLAVIMTRMYRHGESSLTDEKYSDILAALTAQDADAAEHALRSHLTTELNSYQDARRRA